MLPFYLKDSSFEGSDEALYYILAQDGLYLIRRNPFFSTELRVDGLPWLEPHREKAQLHLPAKIPAQLLEQAVEFFRTVFDRFQSEAILLLYYIAGQQRYELIAPEQEVAPLSCDYKLPASKEGCVRIGTVHSHGALEAGHSDVDARDEQYDDGLHLTVGNLDSLPSISCELVAGTRRFSVPLAEVVDRQAPPVPASWLEAVSGSHQG